MTLQTIALRAAVQSPVATSLTRPPIATYLTRMDRLRFTRLRIQRKAITRQISSSLQRRQPHEQSLTVIFKSGRAPIEVENYLMTAKVLTDLDSEHYEQIPLDQIDLAATQNFNKAAGVEFQVPGASRN